MNLAALGVLLQAMLNMPKQLVRILLMNASSSLVSEPVSLFNCNSNVVTVTNNYNLDLRVVQRRSDHKVSTFYKADDILWETVSSEVWAVDFLRVVIRKSNLPFSSLHR